MRYSLIFASMTFLFACDTPLGDIQSEYSRVARQTGIVPVFPPKEDVQVGDIYALSAGGPNDVLREWIGEDPSVVDLAAQYMNSRLVFRETVATKGDLQQNASAQTDTYGRSFALRAQQRIESLPIEALPSITADAGVAFGLGRSNPLTALGLGAGQRIKVRVDFGDVRTYGIPRVRLTSTGYDPRLQQAAALRSAAETGIRAGMNQSWSQLALTNAYQQAVSAGRDILPLSERCNATILVTKVYLTRRIEFTFLEANAIGLSAARVEAGETAAAPPDIPPLNVTLTQISGVDQIDTTALEAAVDTITSGAQATNPSGGGRATGLTFEGFNALGASFSQTFQRPVVVGYEGWPFHNGGSEEELERCLGTLGLSR